jgi:beta-galactosidase
MRQLDYYGYNETYLMKNGVPWFPVMGEFHYSRYPRKYWKEELQKIKAGGIGVVASYIIWIHHEEEEGEFSVEGNLDLRTFVEKAARCGLKVWLRIGPWIHGEVRNGGFPDWLLKKEFTPRSNDSKYFQYVKKFYGQIASQVTGLLNKDGGPIIGIQIENEYHGVEGMTMEEQELHMVTLTNMAKELGLEVPYYTATGWGSAATGGLIPVMGGYCEAPWDPRITEIEPSGNYIFTHERNDGNIGTDLQPGDGIAYDMNQFPFLTAELGGGVQVTKHRRPIVTGGDIAAMSLTKLGSGVNLLGYYMYHGGKNPVGKLSTFQESKVTGYPNDLPEISYDFMAPIGEYGQVRDSYYEIRMLAMFLLEFGSELCKMKAVLPSDNPLEPDNTKDIRYSYRYNDETGYLFVNNYVRRQKMNVHKKHSFHLELEKKTVLFPAIDIEDGQYFFYPFNMKIGEINLKTALATPLCRLNNTLKTYVFYTDNNPCYEIEGEDNTVEILTLSREDALRATKLVLKKEYLVISEDLFVQTNEECIVYGSKKPTIKTYPPLDKIPSQLHLLKIEHGFGYYTMEEAQEPKERRARISYRGESIKIYSDGKLFADNYYNGLPFEVSLQELNQYEKIKMVIQPLYKDTPVFLEVNPFQSEICQEIDEVTIEPIYSHTITW